MNRGRVKEKGGGHCLKLSKSLFRQGIIHSLDVSIGAGGPRDPLPNTHVLRVNSLLHQPLIQRPKAVQLQKLTNLGYNCKFLVAQAATVIFTSPGYNCKFFTALFNKSRLQKITCLDYNGTFLNFNFTAVIFLPVQLTTVFFNKYRLQLHNFYMSKLQV